MKKFKKRTVFDKNYFLYLHLKVRKRVVIMERGLNMEEVLILEAKEQEKIKHGWQMHGVQHIRQF